MLGGTLLRIHKALSSSKGGPRESEPSLQGRRTQLQRYGAAILELVRES